MNIIQSEELKSLSFINHGFFGREGGKSVPPFASLNVGLNRGDDDETVLKNRAKVTEYFGTTLNNLCIAKQVHQNTAVIVKDSSYVECDALITNKPGLLIGVTTADCVPILLADTQKKYVAAIHSGWRGALLGIIENTFKKLKTLECNDVIAAIGPCIHQKSFQVGDEIINNVDKKYIKNRHFDLSLYVYDKLVMVGTKFISKIDIDTFTNNEYFSYRRGKSSPCGVQFSGIMII